LSSNQSMNLLPQHRELIDRSAISEDVARARGYRSVSTKSELHQLGFSPRQCRIPALLIPVWNAAGEIANYQIRPDEPRVNERGKAVKYETPKNSRMILDVPPPARAWIGDPKRPLFITEGIRKADAAVSIGLCCVDLLGVWNWRGTNEHGGKVALPDWEYIALSDRQVYICFDSDAATKPEVCEAMARLKSFLEQRKATVDIIRLPVGEGGAKVGLDDFLVAGHGIHDLLSLVSHDLPRLYVENTPPEDRYRETPTGLVWMKQSADGSTVVPMTNFTARIVAEVICDDGAERTSAFEIEAILDSRTARFTVPAGRYSNLNWAMENLGPAAVVYPGVTLRDHARTAIQLLSGDVPTRRIFAHTGWRKIDGRWAYLHAGGAVGEEGPVPGVEVALGESLPQYELPEPPSGSELVDAVLASLGFLNVAPSTVTVPLYAAIWTAVIASPDFSIHISGPTGAGKSELAALVQQHWGAGMDARHLPGSWSSTANALEHLAFAAKDAVLVVDDFVPLGTAGDVDRLHREADRLLRAQGNRSGRRRMSPDASLKPVRAPRGLIVSTGEDTPKGQSLRARMVIVEMEPNSVDWDLFSICRQDAAEGLYAKTMSGFLKWLAPRYEEVASEIRQSTAALRKSTGLGTKHKRTPDNIGKLKQGLRLFFSFARDVGALSEDDASTLEQTCILALDELACSQSQQQAASDPVRRFVELLRAAIACGYAYVADGEGERPANCAAWGWRRVGADSEDKWQPQGAKVGWLCGDDLYLEPQASFAAAQRMAREQGDHLPLSAKTLHKKMQQHKLLLSTEARRNTLTVRRTLEGIRRNVLHVHAGSIMPPETAQTDQIAQSEIISEQDERQIGQFAGQVRSSIELETDQWNRPAAPNLNVQESTVDGLGSLGSFSEYSSNRAQAERVIAEAIRQELEHRGIPQDIGGGIRITDADRFAHSYARDLLSDSQTLSQLAREWLSRTGFDVDALIELAKAGSTGRAVSNATQNGVSAKR
jgi:hypothetical protein